MADVKKEIKFNTSMTIDKRNADFAYLRRNVFPSRSPGLYPSASFRPQLPDATSIYSYSDIMDILGSREPTGDGFNYKIKVIVQEDTDIKFFDLGSNTQSNTSLGAKRFECATFGADGVKIAVNNDHIYTVQHVNGNTTLDSGILSGATPNIGAYDGLYYWWISENEIYRQLGSAAATVAFNNVGLTTRFVDFLNDQMVLFCERGSAIVVLFWDKSDPDLFTKRIIIPNAKLVAGGVVNGRLMLVRTVGNSSNPKERNGEIVISGYDGEKFVRLNSIKGGRKDVQYVEITGVGIGSETMQFSVTKNLDAHNTDLYQNYIYKVQNDGSIEIQELPTDTAAEVHIVRIFYNFVLYATRGGATVDLIYANESTNTNYTAYDYYDNTTYITNFMCEPYNYHKLDGISFSFEKLFKDSTAVVNTAGEILEVYYRVSERDAFTLIGTITCQKVIDNVNQRRDDTGIIPIPEQRYQFVKCDDGTSLPEFNEIQYQFISKNGFSVIGAWHEYSYLSRNTMN